MRTTLLKRGVHVFLLLLTLCAGGYLSPVSADPASFAADLKVSLIFPAPFPGALAVAVGANPVLPPCVAVGVGGAAVACNNATSTFVGNTLNFTAGPINGMAGPPGSFAFARSTGTSHTITLTNLTPFGLTVPLTVNFDFSLMATALPGEFASAAVFFQVINVTTGVVLFDVRGAALPNESLQLMGQFPFDLFLPPGATDIRIEGFVEGQAAGVPEPATMILLGTGLFGVAIKARKKLKSSKNSREANG